MDLLLRNARLGLLLVFIVLGLFLEIRLALWVMLGIPISVLGALFLMPAADVSINMISLFAFILALGIVVDDAIVVGENVYAHRERGKPYLQGGRRRRPGGRRARDLLGADHRGGLRAAGLRERDARQVHPGASPWW